MNNLSSAIGTGLVLQAPVGHICSWHFYVHAVEGVAMAGTGTIDFVVDYFVDSRWDGAFLDFQYDAVDA